MPFLFLLRLVISHTFSTFYNKFTRLIKLAAQRIQYRRVTFQRIKSILGVESLVAGKSLGEVEDILEYILANRTHSLDNHVPFSLWTWTTSQ